MEWLANLSVKWILVLVGSLFLLRTGLAHSRRGPAPAIAREVTDAALTALTLIFLLVRPYCLQAFFVSSPSMQPTLLVTDRLLVNKLIYRIRPPRRGEIVVFRPPPNTPLADREYIKRVVAMPGDMVETVPDRLWLDGRVVLSLTREAASHLRAQDAGDRSIGFTLPVGGGSVDVRDQSARIRPEGGPEVEVELVDASLPIRIVGSDVRVGGKRRLTGVFARPEASSDFTHLGGDHGVPGLIVTLSGSPRLILLRGRRLSLERGHLRVNGRAVDERYLQQPPGYAMSPTRVPPGTLFVMGDNRNDSLDSHVWGPLEMRFLEGRAECIFWPTRRARILGSAR